MRENFVKKKVQEKILFNVTFDKLAGSLINVFVTKYARMSSVANYGVECF